MAENPRELIRAAQSAETQGDVARAVECLQKAAELYRQSGNPSRALQLLRHAQRLDGSRADIADAVNRLEWMPEAARARHGPDLDGEAGVPASGLDAELLPEVVHRQRLIEDALREAALVAGDDTPAGAAQSWVIETEAAEDSQRLEAQLARVAGEVDDGEVSGSQPSASAGGQGDSASAPGWGVVLSGMNVPSASMAPVASVSAWAPGMNVPSVTDDGAPQSADALGAAPPRRRREARLIERGPTRADAALDAWCSFCCRPRTDTGDLVAGPAGAFICKSCLNESQSLLGDVAPKPPPVVSRTERPAEPVMGLVGQQATQALLTQSLEAQARCLLVVGPEGSGKSVWFQQLQREDVGVITAVADLEGAGTSRVLLVEDVERLDAAAHAALRAFLARDHRPAVVLGARGQGSEARGLTLRDEARSAPVLTTAALSQAVRGAVPTDLLEHVQVLLPLQVPTHAEFMEIARQRLAARAPAVSVAEDVLAALAQEAGRSSRAGHELHALLNRVPTGTWGLAPTEKASSARKARRKRTS
ncbi:ClpX C4-type zinc finger protein [Corallococcus macrosporus]|uniref:TPR repeat-containing ClpX C4-type zinc finger protein n=1 Tax=Myxococcus fulvus (strain ATCC BAA-855 / HW-1) TaxID=483219 RepID=F8CLL6_MYXFH|nr:ClpX C4-type zinc finger protein [Corallococcus macrosporus]AEI67725.1 TPR repeat-containing ClpX C4-type zinc finger protein [Corallococcus macrosporus]